MPSLLPCLSLRAASQCNYQQIAVHGLGQRGCDVLVPAHMLSPGLSPRESLGGLERGTRKDVAASRRCLLLANKTRQMAC